MPRVNRRQFLQSAAAAAAAAPFVGCRRARRPNVVFVLSDDLRWDCMGVAGHPFLKTPNIDRIANEGIRFSNAFCTSSLCSPSRASFLSGLYAHSHQVINNFTEFPPTIPSYPQRLHDAGYHTAYIGKWHMGEGNDEKRPGFDYWASHKGQGQYYDTQFNVDGQRQVIKGYYSHVVTNLATDWLKTARRPFSLDARSQGAARTVDSRSRSTSTPSTTSQIKKPDDCGARARHAGLGHAADQDVARHRWPAVRREGLRQVHPHVSRDDSVGGRQRRRDLRHAARAWASSTTPSSSSPATTASCSASTPRSTSGRCGRRASASRCSSAIRKAMRDPRVVDRMVLNLDVAPSVLDLCGAPPLPNVHGASFRTARTGSRSAVADAPGCTSTTSRRSFRTRPTCAACGPTSGATCTIRTARGSRTRRRRSSTTSRRDPRQKKNLIDASEAQATLASLKAELLRIQQTTGGLPDTMPRQSRAPVRNAGRGDSLSATVVASGSS